MRADALLEACVCPQHPHIRVRSGVGRTSRGLEMGDALRAKCEVWCSDGIVSHQALVDSCVPHADQGARATGACSHRWHSCSLPAGKKFKWRSWASIPVPLAC